MTLKWGEGALIPPSKCIMEPVTNLENDKVLSVGIPQLQTTFEL